MAQSPDRTLDRLGRENADRASRPYGPQSPADGRGARRSGSAYGMILGVLSVVLIVVVLISVTLAF